MNILLKNLMHGIININWTIKIIGLFIKFINVQTATNKEKFGFINTLLKNYCLKISPHRVKKDGILSYKYFIEPIKNIDEIIEYRIKTGKTFKGIENFKTYSTFKYSEYFTEPTNNNNDGFIDDEHIKNNICNYDENDEEDFTYIKHGLPVTKEEYYNKKIITDDKNISICNNNIENDGFIDSDNEDNNNIIDEDNDNNNICNNDEIENDGFIDD